VSAARTFAAKHGYDLDSRQEFVGIGAADLAAALGQGYPVAVDCRNQPSTTRWVRVPRSPWSSLDYARFVSAVPDRISGKPAKSAACGGSPDRNLGLFDFLAVFRMWRVSRLDFYAAAVAIGGVLLLGSLQGILFAALASILLLLARAARVQVAFIGRIPGTNSYSDLERHPENEALCGVVGFRPEASLIYVNADAVLEMVLSRVRAPFAVAIKRVRPLGRTLRRPRGLAHAALVARRTRPTGDRATHRRRPRIGARSAASRQRRNKVGGIDRAATLAGLLDKSVA
jgi:MFS superfamily sulfate permease-like transporter